MGFGIVLMVSVCILLSIGGFVMKCLIKCNFVGCDDTFDAREMAKERYCLAHRGEMAAIAKLNKSMAKQVATKSVFSHP